MRDVQTDTPPSSISGDDIGNMDDEGVMYMEEVTLDEAIEMLEGSDPEDDGEAPERPEDHSQLVFREHNGPIFNCDLHPNGKLAVTGSEDDKAFVWSVETGKLVMNCTGHKDSVVFVGFSHDGAYLGTADMSGVIKVWKCNLEDDNPWTCIFDYESEDLHWGFWHFGTRVLLCGTESGDIYVFKIPSGETKVLQGHNVKTECAKLFPDGLRLAAGYEDGSVKVWDLKSCTVVQQVPNTIHNTRVTAIDTYVENNLMASVSTDGKIVFTTSNNGKVVGQVQTDEDLEVISFCTDPHLKYFATGTLQGAVSIWDASRQTVRHQCAKVNDDQSSGVTTMIWVKDHLVTGCLDGSIRVYRGRTGEKCLQLTGHMAEVLDLSYNENQNIILAVSEDFTARVFACKFNSDND